MFKTTSQKYYYRILFNHTEQSYGKFVNVGEKYLNNPTNNDDIMIYLDHNSITAQGYVPKLTTPMWVAVGPMLIDDTTLTIKLMTSCQLSTPGGLVFLMLPE